MGFDTEYDQWIKAHMKRRTGERLDALRRGSQSFGNRLFVERIWWPLTGHFHGLHPEYEVRDWRGRPYYADFMWIVGASRFIFEIMDYGSHGTDRSQYRKDFNRGLYLQAQDYRISYIPLDELKENPAFILSMLRGILTPHLLISLDATASSTRPYSRIERDLMRAAIRRNRIIRPHEAVAELELDTRTVIKYCRILVGKGKFRAVAKGASQRVNYYEYIGSIQSPDLY
jgi:hypothetical protein